MASQEAIELLESVLNESKNGNAYRRAYDVRQGQKEAADKKIKAAYVAKWHERQNLINDAKTYENAGDKKKAQELRTKAVKMQKELKDLENKNHLSSEELLVDELRKENIPGYAKEEGKKYVASQNKKSPNARINAQINRNQANPGSYANVKLEAAEILIEALSAIFED